MSTIDFSKTYSIGVKVNTDSVVYLYYFRYGGDERSRLHFYCDQFHRNRTFAKRWSSVPLEVRESDPYVKEFFDRWYGKDGQELSDREQELLKSHIRVLKDLCFPFVESDGGEFVFDLMKPSNARSLAMLEPHRAYRIKWDTDGKSYKECGLPTSVFVPYDMGEEEVEDYLSNRFGYCHFGYKVNF